MGPELLQEVICRHLLLACQIIVNKNNFETDILLNQNNCLRITPPFRPFFQKRRGVILRIFYFTINSLKKFSGASRRKNKGGIQSLNFLRRFQHGWYIRLKFYRFYLLYFLWCQKFIYQEDQLYTLSRLIPTLFKMTTQKCWPCCNSASMIAFVCITSKPIWNACWRHLEPKSLRFGFV